MGSHAKNSRRNPFAWDLDSPAWLSFFVGLAFIADMRHYLMSKEAHMSKQKKPRFHMPKWLTITFLVLGILFLLGGTTGEVDMLVIGAVLMALAIAGFVRDKKPRTAQPEKVTSVATSVAQHQPTQQQKKKGWYAKWWGILLIIFVFMPIGIIAFTVALSIANDDGSKNDSTQTIEDTAKQQSEEQKKKTAAKYQETIDTYAPLYCKNHQDITVNEPDLLKDGWPLADNQAGITDDECKTLLGLLYLQRADDSRVTEFIKSIAERKVAIGMTKVEVVYAWGSPNDINRTTTGGGTHEQWVFGNPIYGANYVYFDNDTVTSIQN